MKPRAGVAGTLVFVLPARRDLPEPLFWERIRVALSDLGIRTDVITAVMKLQPPPEHRAFLPSAGFVWALLRSPAPTFLCIEYSVATLLTAAVARLRGKRTIILQEHRGREGRPLPRWERLYRLVVATFAHAFIANTDAAYHELTHDIGVDERKIFRATLIVPPERAALSREAVAVAEPARRPLFLFAGRLIKLKNVGSLVDAAAELRARGFEFEVWIVGDGPERTDLEEQAGDLVREGVVRFLGRWHPATIGAAYEAADVFVMPTFQDYRSVAVLEALRFGKPVIDSARDGNALDFVHHESTGLVFEPFERGALGAAMERAITEPDLVRALGRRASELMEKQTPQTAAAALREILETVATR
jgi:glycosyltransferase involved in cell wall biosynthesis